MSAFAEFGLSPALISNLSKQAYSTPYPIQQAAIPAILSGKDVLGIAQTGSGKTASFVLPILQQFQRKEVAKNRYIKALILVPTRELAVQVGDVFTMFSANLPRPVKVLTVFGGVSINPQMKNLMGVEILVATPGRFLELVENNAIQMLHLDILVLDEADKMLNLGFKDEMTRIFKLLPTRRQNLLFSATLGQDIHAITELILRNPVKIEIRQVAEILGQINQIGYRVTEERKGPLLRFLIKNQALKQVLVFVSSIDRADKVVNKLKQNGINALALHGDKSQNARTEALRYFKSGEISVLVATDLASRGLDIPFLPTVVNYELPRSPKDFIHRIGRTGRAGSEGTAISFVSADENHHFRVIQKKMEKIVEMVETDGFDLLGY